MLRTISRGPLAALLLAGALPTAVWAACPSPENQVFQFMARQELALPTGRPRPVAGYLWIPPACRLVRGVIVAGQNVPEHGLVGHPAIRAACTEADLAILWCCPSFFDWTIKDGDHHARVLDALVADLATRSGYDELASAPWLPIGESMHLQMVLQLLAARPDRCIAGVQIKNASTSPPDVTVPMLCAIGTTSEWDQEKVDLLEQWRDVRIHAALRRQRAATPRWPASLLIEGGSGHFECTERMTGFIARYLLAAARARLPDVAGEPLRPVDLAAGTVAGLPVAADAVEPVRLADCPPEHRDLPWYFTPELAREAVDLARINWRAATQVVAFADERGRPIPFGHRGIFSPLPWSPEADGISFRLRTTFLDAIPEGWIHGDTPLGHAAGAPRVDWICGPVVPLGDDRFRIALDRSWGSTPVYLQVWHPGDAVYRHSVQPGEIRLTPNRTGQPQTISFEPIPDQPTGAVEVPLRARSDAGLPVRFFVRAGPAEVHGDRLVLTAIPPRSRLPLAVTVAAWQWGRGGPPAVQTAAIVERTFQIVAPGADPAPPGGPDAPLKAN